MAYSVTLQTSDQVVSSGDVIGRVAYAASNESSGSDAILIAGAIESIAEGDFTAVANPASLVFSTSTSAAASEQMRLTSEGYLGINTSYPAYHLDVSGSGRVDLLNINGEFTFPTSDGLTNQMMMTDGSGILTFVSGVRSDTAGITDSSGVNNIVYLSQTAYDNLPSYDDETLYYIPGSTGGGGTLDGSGVVNHIAFWSDTDTLTYDENQLYWDSTNNRLGIGTSTPTAKLNVEGGVVFNEDGSNFDFRVEGDTDANLLFVDASTDTVAVGGVAARAGYKFTSYGFISAEATNAKISAIDSTVINKIQSDTTKGYIGTETNHALRIRTNNLDRIDIDQNGNLVFNESGGDVDFRIESQNEEYAFYVNGANRHVGLGTSDPSGVLHVSGPDTSSMRFDILSGSGPYGSGDIQTVSFKKVEEAVTIEHADNPASTGGTNTQETQNLIRMGTNFISMEHKYTSGLGVTYFPKFYVDTDTGECTINDEYTMPTSDGLTNQMMMTDGSGVLTFTSGVRSETTGITGASGINNIVYMSQTDYDNLSSYDNETLYYIV